jgi:hypothetical protein
MNDEFIDVWRKEFESMMKKERPLNSLKRLPDDSAYIDRDTFYLEQGFLMAKRSQKVVELPKRGQGFYLDDMVNLDDVIESLTAAGIQYTVK